jgi:hypothetical protein
MAYSVLNPDGSLKSISQIIDDSIAGEIPEGELFDKISERAKKEKELAENKPAEDGKTDTEETKPEDGKTDTDKTKPEDDKSETEKEKETTEDKNKENTVSSAKIFNDVMVDDIPIYTHYVKRHKNTKSGIFSYDSSYLKRYYSMLDAGIYFGDTHIEDILDINWNIIQNQMPLFGYNSYVYDEIALGARFITGAFSINFTSPNYLFYILDRLGQQPISAKKETEAKANDTATTEVETKTDSAAKTETVAKTAEEQIVQEQPPWESLKIEAPDRAPIWKPSFDISVVYGDRTNGNKSAGIILEGVQIKDCRQGAGISPSPVIETYTFIAKDVKTGE